jgi:integrase
MEQYLIRFVVGGLMVSAFAAVGDVVRPKSFAGLFGAAPSIAIATLLIALLKQGPSYIAIEGRSMILTRAGVAAKFMFLVHSHMLRHACGFKLANDGHDTRAIQAYLGHRSIMSTVRYTALTPNRFKNFWKD